MIACAAKLTRLIWKDGYRYSKAGVMLSDFSDPEKEQKDLFADDSQARARSEVLMETLDCINGSGMGWAQFARQQINERSWEVKREMLSPSYMSRWEDIPTAR